MRSVENRLLRALSETEYERLATDLQTMPLRMNDLLHEPGVWASSVYFPAKGVISMLTVLASGTAIEVATIGNEGMADLSAFFGLRTSPARLLVQVPGWAYFMNREAFDEHLARSTELRQVLGQYSISMFIEVSQTAACNRLHVVEQRCARWLLMTHDRVDGDKFPITQEFLSEMLGVRRATVSVAAEGLQRADLIRYRRGEMEILDREGLEARACECYAIIRERFDALGGGPRIQESGRRLLSSGRYASAPQQDGEPNGQR